MTELNISRNQKSLEKINTISTKKKQSLHNLLDSSYSSKQSSHTFLIQSFSKNILLHKIKSILRENEFLKELNEYKRSDPDILKTLIDIINSKDITGTTPIMKTIAHDDITTLNYLLNKLTCKIAIYNKVSPTNKIYLHNILDTTNSDNQTALHLAARTNINCYNLIMDYMKKNYVDFSKFISNNVVSDNQQLEFILDKANTLIQNSFSLSIFWASQLPNKLPPLAQLKYNIISSSVHTSQRTLHKILSNNVTLSTQHLRNILSIDTLCKKLDNVHEKDPDIALSKFRILTEPDVSTGLTPIMQACKNDNFQTLSILINEIESIKEYYPFHVEFENYLDIYDNNYNTALSFAIKNKSIKCINLLLQFGATLGNDFEYTKSDSYIIQAINVKNTKILELLIQHYKQKNKNVANLKNYLSATTSKSNYLSPLVVAINNLDINSSRLLFEKYNVPMPEQYKKIYDALLKGNKISPKSTRDNFLTKITRNILNSILSILYFLGIIRFKNTSSSN